LLIVQRCSGSWSAFSTDWPEPVGKSNCIRC
jgi:hypothetical protein